MQMASINDSTASTPLCIPNSWENPGFSSHLLHQHEFLGSKKVLGQRVLGIPGEAQAPERGKMLWHQPEVSRHTPRH